VSRLDVGELLHEVEAGPVDAVPAVAAAHLAAADGR
jgi:hypothetical protein